MPSCRDRQGGCVQKCPSTRQAQARLRHFLQKAGAGDVHQYQQVLQVGELVQGDVESPPANDKVKDKLAQCLDHVSRVQCDGGSCLGFEISDGLCTRCGVAMEGDSAWRLLLGSAWLSHQERNGVLALTDKLMLAFYTYRRLQILLAAAAEPRADESSPSEQLQVAAGSLLEVLEEGEEEGGEEGQDGDSPGRSRCDAQLLHDQLSARRRLTVRVSATLGQTKLPAGGAVLVLAGRLDGDGKSMPRDVIARVGCNPGLARKSNHYQQLAREQLALESLRGAGAPYLPRLVAIGVVRARERSPAAGADLSGAPVLLTEPRGAPLHRHLAWSCGATMAPQYVLLAAACLAAAAFTLLVYGVRSNDIRPENVTVTAATTPASVQGCIYHLVDLGAATCPAVNSPAFRAAWGLTGRGDVSASAPVCDLLFGPLEALLASRYCFDPPPLLPLSDMQSVLFTLVFLASGSLPWAQAARSHNLDAAIEGRQQALCKAAAWEGLAVLPEPVASFGAWVLGNAGRDTVPVHEAAL